MKKYTYQAKTFEDAKNVACAELMDTIDNLFVREIESTNKLFNKKSVIEVVKKEDVIEYIKDLLKSITNFMDLKINLEVKKREDNVCFTIYSDNNAILIGRNAKTLESLTNFVKHALFNQLGIYYNFVLDISEYKMKKQFYIEKVARRTAKEVSRTKIEAVMEPMNSYERRIVHNALTNFKNVYTESVGEEPNRCVVIKYKENDICDVNIDNETTNE